MSIRTFSFGFFNTIIPCMNKRGKRYAHSTKKELVLAPQNIVELWVVATRPKEVNGLGLTPSRAALYMARIMRTFPVLLETPVIHREWQRLVVTHRVFGKKAHDTRLVAAMLVNGVEEIVTFNGDDFRRYSGIKVLHLLDFAG